MLLQLPTAKTTHIITWHARRFANGAEWKFESEANDTAGPEFNTVISNSRNVQVDELKPFWNKHSSQLIEKRNSCAHLCNCFAVWCSHQRRKRSRTAFFYAELNLFADLLKHLRKSQVYEFIQPYWGGGGKRRGLGPRNDVLTTCKVVNPRASQRPSKAAVRFLVISTLALSFE